MLTVRYFICFSTYFKFSSAFPFEWDGRSAARTTHNPLSGRQTSLLITYSAFPPKCQCETNFLFICQWFAHKAQKTKNGKHTWPDLTQNMNNWLEPCDQSGQLPRGFIYSCINFALSSRDNKRDLKLGSLPNWKYDYIIVRCLEKAFPGLGF